MFTCTLGLISPDAETIEAKLRDLASCNRYHVLMALVNRKRDERR